MLRLGHLKQRDSGKCVIIDNHSMRFEAETDGRPNHVETKYRHSPAMPQFLVATSETKKDTKKEMPRLASVFAFPRMTGTKYDTNRDFEIDTIVEWTRHPEHSASMRTFTQPSAPEIFAPQDPADFFSIGNP
jgi:hypothetical protein